MAKLGGSLLEDLLGLDPGHRGPRVDTALGYFEANAGRMRYARFRTLGLFVGSVHPLALRSRKRQSLVDGTAFSGKRQADGLLGQSGLQAALMLQRRACRGSPEPG